jgi:hypothetical protein
VRRICAWCGIDLELESAGDAGPEAEKAAANPRTSEPAVEEPSGTSGVTPTICRRCANDLAAYRKPVLVVSREWVRMYDQLIELLKGQPEIQVILDRRQTVRASENSGEWDGPDRRKRQRPLALE